MSLVRQAAMTVLLHGLDHRLCSTSRRSGGNVCYPPSVKFGYTHQLTAYLNSCVIASDRSVRDGLRRTSATRRSPSARMVGRQNAPGPDVALARGASYLMAADPTRLSKIYSFQVI